VRKKAKDLKGGAENRTIDEDVVVDVNHVDMIFNIASERLDSLKEYFIKLVRHELMFKEFKALDDISFQVRRGDVFGLVGTNGSGKSTMLKIIAGVLEPSAGTCTVRGSIAPLIELGAGFDPELTARENIYLNGALLGYSRKFIDEHFDEIVEFAELRDFLDMPLKNYSSGMVARIAFAIATATEPDLLIVDETLSVGDFLFQKKCEDRIQSLINDSHVTVMLVSHDTSQVERMCDRCAWIEKGELRMVDDADKVCAAYRSLER
jgi:ABC-2 type transport system ATP-binding protein